MKKFLISLALAAGLLAFPADAQKAATGPKAGVSANSGGSGGAGTEGPAGTPGSVWRNGSGIPSNAVGINGDYYLDTVTGDVYLRAAGTYSVVTNIKGSTGDAGATGAPGLPGATGDPGAAGAAGAAGASGSVWRDGAGVPSDAVGVNGDYYLNDTTGDVYLRVTGTYSLVANIKGATGAAGANGAAGATGPAGPVAGTAGQVIFNADGTSPGGDAGLTYDAVSDTLTVVGPVVTNGGLQQTQTTLSGSLVPVMTSNTAPSGTASADRQGTSVWRIFDGDNGTEWTEGSAPYAPPGWVAYNFATPTVVNSYTFRNEQESYLPRNWIFQGSQNGSTWTDLDTRVVTGLVANTDYTYTFANTTAYAHYRLYVTLCQNNDPGFAPLKLSTLTFKNTALAVERLRVTGSGDFLGSKSKTLTDGAATTFATFPLADGASLSGEIIYTIRSVDGTAKQSRKGRAQFTATRETDTTYTVGIGEMGGSVFSGLTGTLTGQIEISCAAGVCSLAANYNSSQTTPVLTGSFRFDSTDAGLALSYP